MLVSRRGADGAHGIGKAAAGRAVSGRPGAWPLTRRTAAAVTMACALAATLVLSGCGAANVKIAIASAYIPQPTTPGTTVAYLDIRNNAAAADRLVSASTSVGGQVGFLAPDGMRDGTMMMKLVNTIAIPGDSLMRMNPNSFRLRITGAGPMQGGKDITLTLKFAHGGTINVIALVTNPESGGNSYFLN